MKDEKDGDSSIHSFAFSPDGRILAVGGQPYVLFGNTGRIKLWDLTTGRGVSTITCEEVVEQVAFAPDGKLLAAVESKWAKGIGYTGVVHVWDVSKLVPQAPDR